MNLLFGLKRRYPGPLHILKKKNLLLCCFSIFGYSQTGFQCFLRYLQLQELAKSSSFGPLQSSIGGQGMNLGSMSAAVCWGDGVRCLLRLRGASGSAGGVERLGGGGGSCGGHGGPGTTCIQQEQNQLESFLLLQIVYFVPCIRNNRN